MLAIPKRLKSNYRLLLWTGSFNSFWGRILPFYKTLNPKIRPQGLPDLKENDDQIITLFQKDYAQERDPIFQKRIGTILDMENSLGPIPRNQRILARPELMELFNGNEHGDFEIRDQIISEAFKFLAYTQSEIAVHLGLHKTTISKIISKTN